jgi:hypothetical protein
LWFISINYLSIKKKYFFLNYLNKNKLL